MKRAFVTGGTGFVGANLVRLLVENGWAVSALVRENADTRNLDGLDLTLVRGDLASLALARELAGVDALFHVAATYSLFRADRAAVVTANVDGTRALLAAAKIAGVPRTVYTSSVSAIGVKSHGVADEAYQSARERLIGAYKRSKYDAERVALAAAADGLDVTIVNPSTPIGPWDRKPTPTGEIIVRLLQRRMPAIVDTGLNFVSVEDVARGHLLAYERGRSGRRYILGDENLTLRAFLSRVGAVAGVAVPTMSLPHWLPLAAAFVDETVSPLVGRKPTVAIDGVRMSREAMYYRTDRARTELGYTTSGLEGGIERAVAWFVANGYAS